MDVLTVKGKLNFTMPNQTWQSTPGAGLVCFHWLLARRGCTVRSAPTAAKCTMKAIELVGAVLASVFLVVGCTATHTTKSDASVSKDRQRYETPENGPFLEQFEADEHVRAAVLKVLAMHRFSRPCIVIRGQSGAVWFTADRLEGKVEGFESFDRVFVGVAASGQSAGPDCGVCSRPLRLGTQRQSFRREPST